jgi:asparagine synthase (glutamine-hydrolysing)
MCGIAGIVHRYDQKYTTSDILKISEILKHRGPDDEGFCLIDENHNPQYFKGKDSPHDVLLPQLEENKPFQTAFLHRRLSIIDLSSNGHQPMEKNGCIIVYNGEIYNYQDIRKELEKKGHTFKTQTDTEVILTAYLEKGDECVQQFRGMWSFVIYDTRKKYIFFSRDRFGIKPLYIYHTQKEFIFASEIKAITALKGLNLELDNNNLASYLAYGTTQKPYGSLYKNIDDFPPAHVGYYFIETGLTFCKPYYTLPNGKTWEDKHTKADLCSLDLLFNNSVKRHFHADVEVGSCLSGGLDSSLIVAKIAELNPDKTIKTFTAAYHNPEIDESDYAKMVANTYPNVQPYFTYPSGDTFLDELDKLLYYQDLPIGSTSIFAHWEVMKSVKNDGKISVVLDGQGADEIFGGYFNFAGLFLIDLLKKGKFKRFFTEYSLLKQNFTPAMFSVLLKAIYYFIPEPLQKIIRMQERLSFRFIDKSFHSQIDVPQRGGKSFLEHARLSVEWNLYDLLRYEDRNSMAFSIESRVPFLDHHLVDVALLMPLEDKIKNGWTKYPIRSLMKKTKLPPEIVWRKGKKGFITPQEEWKKQLSERMKDEMRYLDLPEIMNKQYITEIINQPITNNWHLSEFWRAYSVIKWYNRNKN